MEKRSKKYRNKYLGVIDIPRAMRKEKTCGCWYLAEVPEGEDPLIALRCPGSGCGILCCLREFEIDGEGIASPVFSCPKGCGFSRRIRLLEFWHPQSE